jgi:putative SOS response-associated peptidase YedK
MDDPKRRRSAVWRWYRQGRAHSVESCTILTAPAPGPIAAIHPRMPVVLAGGCTSSGWIPP